MSVIQEYYQEKLLEGIQWRKSRNGLYFQFFDDVHEASYWLAEQAVRYRYAKELTISQIVEDAKDRGIVVYNTKLGKWFKKYLNLTIKQQRPKIIFDPDEYKKPSTISLTKEIRDALKPLGKHHMKSWWIETIIRANINMEVENVVVWMDGGAVVFYDEGNDIRCIHLHPLSNSTIQVIQGWCDMAQEDEGLYTVSHLAKTHGFKTRGFDDEDK